MNECLKTSNKLLRIKVFEYIYIENNLLLLMLNNNLKRVKRKVCLC